MNKLFLVSPPPATFYVGVIFVFMKNESEYLLTVKDQYQDRINIKLPGGTSEEKYKNLRIYEQDLKEILTKLKFTSIGQKKVFHNEEQKINIFQAFPEREDAHLIMRTMVMELLEEVGYYPADIRPTLIMEVKKDNHIQYFVEVTQLLDRKGQPIEIPEKDPDFIPIDPDIIETRSHLDFRDYKELIKSHRRPIAQYFGF